MLPSEGGFGTEKTILRSAKRNMLSALANLIPADRPSCLALDYVTENPGCAGGSKKVPPMRVTKNSFCYNEDAVWQLQEDIKRRSFKQ